MVSLIPDGQPWFAYTVWQLYDAIGWFTCCGGHVANAVRLEFGDDGYSSESPDTHYICMTSKTKALLLLLLHVTDAAAACHRCTRSSICLDAFEAGEVLRALPGCQHLYHADCIGGWLLESAT